MQIQDNLKVNENQKQKDIFSPTESLLYSGELLKINKKKLKQKRKLIITTENVYNMRDDNFFLSALSNMGLTSLVKRKLAVTNIGAIVYARLGNEFIIHVPDEFDYRIVDRHKDKLIEYILHAQHKQGVEELLFYFNSDIELHKYTTHNSHKKKGIHKNPQGETKMMTLNDFREFVNEKLRLIRQDADNTEMLINYLNNYNKITIDDFTLQKIIGRGGFATVYKCEKKDTGEIFALKSVRKLAVIEKNQFESIRREKEILHNANHPFLVGLKCAFQTPDKLFFLMPFIECGDLSVHLRRRRFFFENEVKFFTAQVILALNFLHTQDIIYQDLKPANLQLETNGYIKLTDFGAAKYSYQTKKYRTFIGTLDYIAPEVLKRQPYTKSVDWWSLGILVYQQLYGKLPFYDKNPKNVVNKILTQDIEFMDDTTAEKSTNVNVVSDECKGFIRSCQNREPELRIGFENAEEQLSHEWFAELDIAGLSIYSVNAPLIPEMPDEEDEDDNEENKEKDIDSPRLSVLEEGILNEIQKFDPMFKGFYLDQLNTPTPQTPVGVTPPPELARNTIASDKNINEMNFADTKSEKSRSRVGSYRESDINSVNVKKTNDMKNEIEAQYSTKNEDTYSRSKNADILSQSHNNAKSSKIRDLNIDTRGFANDDSVSEGVGSCLRSPVQQSPSMGSTTEKTKITYNFDLYSPAILMEKEASLRIPNKENTEVTDNISDQHNTKTSSQLDSLSNQVKNKELGIFKETTEDEEKFINVEVQGEINAELSEELNDNNSNNGDKSPFSTKSGLVKNQMKLIYRQQKDDSNEKTDKVTNQDDRKDDFSEKDSTEIVNVEFIYEKVDNNNITYDGSFNGETTEKNEEMSEKDQIQKSPENDTDQKVQLSDSKNQSSEKPIENKGSDLLAGTNNLDNDEESVKITLFKDQDCDETKK